MAMRAPTKKETLLGFLARGVAMVHLDARRPGVGSCAVRERPHLRLNLSYRYSIPDLESPTSASRRPFRSAGVLSAASFLGAASSESPATSRAMARSGRRNLPGRWCIRCPIGNATPGNNRTPEGPPPPSEAFLGRVDGELKEKSVRGRSRTRRRAPPAPPAGALGVHAPDRRGSRQAGCCGRIGKHDHPSRGLAKPLRRAGFLRQTWPSPSEVAVDSEEAAPRRTQRKERPPERKGFAWTPLRRDLEVGDESTGS